MTSFCLDDIDLDTLFKDIDVFVVSGITVALNQTVKAAVIEMLRYCRGNNILVVYDNNYRSKMWSLEDAEKAFREILPYVNILSAGHLDAIHFLHLKSSQTTFEGQLEDFYHQIKALYPNLQYITSTKREIYSTSVNDLTGYLYDGHLYKSPLYHIDDIVDRVGGGDAFLSGVLYGLLNHKDIDYCLQFGCCASVLKHTIYGDANDFDIQEIESFMQADVGRINR